MYSCYHLKANRDYHIAKPTLFVSLSLLSVELGACENNGNDLQPSVNKT